MTQTQPQNIAYPGLFQATYYVNPTFTGLQAGSQSNPFTTIAKAFAAATALSLTGALVLLTPNVTITENVVFPDGGNWEIASQTTTGSAGAGNGARINGTVTITNTSANGTNARLTALRVLGAVSGSTANQLSNLFLVNARLDTTLTLTGSGAFGWNVICTGYGTSVGQFGGSINGACSITGGIYANSFSLIGAISVTINSSLVNCRAPVSITVDGTAAAAILTMVGCNFASATTITGISSTQLYLDGFSLANAMLAGLILAGTMRLSTLVSNAGASGAIADNVASTPLGARQPVGLYRIQFDMTQLVAGTLGTLQLNVIYTDMTGALVTVAVGGAGGLLAVNAVLGTKASGSLTFQHNGAAAVIAYSVTGVVTPGALSVALAVAVARVN